MPGYYSEKLAAERLNKCYEIAPLRIQQYLMAEADYVLQKVHSKDIVLDLGCGYGRIIPDLARKSKWVVGIDTSFSSLLFGLNTFNFIPNCSLLNMNALNLSFPNNFFDVVLCIQNGISAFHVDQESLIRESIRVTKPGGTILFSSYSEKFWKDRLEWFELQSREGLLGEIDYEQTRDGVIVCKDGFKATTVTGEQFISLTSKFNVKVDIVEVDESSLFCEIRVKEK
jgi:2-polyprenyl-6-hydroxyphenyl methylase/3-demethylubiquinone-9 3-methyltransferase